jgi:secreted PhoX family phosphatase
MLRMTQLERRAFLRQGAAAGAVLALGPEFWRQAYAAQAVPGRGPYGSLLSADANGVMLPRGFRSRVLARTGVEVAGTDYAWHLNPDGGAVFPQRDGGWVYTSNSETNPLQGGGAGALRFDRQGRVVGAYRILSDTLNNCAGGPTPWGTWLSCEEHALGQVYECRVDQPGNGVVRPALGRFAHEAVTVDPRRKQLYLTEDATDGRFYRFTPDRYPSLDTGRLEALALGATGQVTWVPVVDDRLPQSLVRPQGSMAFNGGEGVWHDSGHVYFTTKGDNRVWDLDIARQRLSVLYDAARFGARAPLTGVDNVTAARSGDLYVAEDGGNLEVVVITAERVVAPVVRLVGHDSSEITGPAFSPDGKRLYFSSQRGTDGANGMTFEITGPFRTKRR